MKYKALLMSPLGLVPAGLQPATAADMPVKAAHVATAWSWTGLYAGVNAGAIFDQSSQSTFRPQAAGTNYCWASDCNYSNKQNSTGVLGGLQIGYNFQSGKMVYGVEVDFDLSSARTTNSGTYPPASGMSGTWTAKTGVESLGTARFRLGYLFDRTLVYATGGLAYAKMANSYQANAASSVSDTGWRTGYAVGGGAEYPLTPNWSVKGEALFYDLGKKDHVSIDTAGGNAVAISEHMTGIVARLGLNYLFH